MVSQAEIRAGITARIMEALKAGTAPWRKPWVDPANAGLPANVISKRAYSGVNPLLLGLAAMERGYTSCWWGTFNQWRTLGTHVSRGERGTRVVLWKPVVKVEATEDGGEELREFLVMREFVVFNAAQVAGRGAERFQPGTRQAGEFTDFQPAEEVIQATGADVRFGGGKAAYFPQGDYIQLPPKESFAGQHEYYGVAFHELAHWSGHGSRLNRLDTNARFGDEQYAREELIAEIAGCFLAAEVGVPPSNDWSNHHAYLATWLRVLENDDRAIFRAATLASAAANYILAFSRARAEGTSEETAGSLAG